MLRCLLIFLLCAFFPAFDVRLFGNGVAKDECVAFVYYEKAAQQGDRVAQYNTGNCYEDGRGCDQSYERAAEWFEKAALQGVTLCRRSSDLLQENT